MAHAAKLGALAEELVAAICNVDAESDKARFEALREVSLRCIRRQNYLRTNQFLIEEHLDGLEERFSVNARDGLASALRQRRDALATYPSRWNPELLHFLLELSDQPLQQSRLADLENLRGPEAEDGPKLRWEDIAEEDGWAQDRSIWKNVNFGADSSDDESYEGSYEEANPTDSSLLSDVTSISSAALPLDRILLAPDEKAEPVPTLEDVAESQSWRLKDPAGDPSGKARKIVITEAQLVREALFMLQGHKTTLFDDKCSPVLAYQLRNVSWDTYRALVMAVGETGRPLLPLRGFVGSNRQDIALLQTFQDCIRRALHSFDEAVSAIQARYADLKSDMVVSVLDVMEELQPRMLQLRSLSAVVQKLSDERYPHAFRCLELLYEAACAAQLEGDEPVYKFLSPTFLDCFQVYLRPIRLWMEEGQLLPGDKIFFISESKVQVPLTQIWRGKFKLRKTHEGVLHAPRFLQPAVSRIFTTGKSIVVLKQLGRYESVRRRRGQGAEEEPSLDLAAICPPGFELAPFGELFDRAFDQWIKSKHLMTSTSLQDVLFESCGLWSTLDAIHSVFLMADGSAADSFSQAVFSKLDRRHTDWHDRFTLTELVQDAFSSLPEAHRVSAAFESSDGRRQSSNNTSDQSSSSVRDHLPRLKLQYRMPWSVQLILGGECMDKYRSIFTLLLQLRRAVHILKGHRLLGDMAARAAAAATSSDPRAGAAEQGLYHRTRARLLWFCNAVLTYLTTLVFAPRAAAVRRDLRAAEDVDAMIAAHAAFVAALVQESCLGGRLDPIRECGSTCSTSPSASSTSAAWTRRARPPR
ncbi:hypothetical protein MAPG_07386 [Magnaporthiopsis poae ATCC 64411]|uniref:Spindle pole body component n=1 Tax=Magnaporthiopsis poae (strain ATCC 64411 / 73-15) TaxID=644358 RepID=A0A0C4E4J2_MAGP6|nr:hypothetical protein MAPG_07386 [Magnaporthiopsis poae ATCC 64411]